MVLEELAEPEGNTARPWPLLLDEERLLDIIKARQSDLVAWSSLWDR